MEKMFENKKMVILYENILIFVYHTLTLIKKNIYVSIDILYVHFKIKYGAARKRIILKVKMSLREVYILG